MPKIYSTEERNNIIHNLKKEARYCMQQYGIKKTTVDMLVSRVHIPKGTFYLFYPTKEILLFEVLLEVHERIEKQLLDALLHIKNNVTSLSLTEVIFHFYQEIDTSGVLKILTSGEIEVLYRKLPSEIITAHTMHDDDFIESIVTTLSLPKKENLEVFSTAFRSLFMTTIAMREQNVSNYQEALKLTIHGLVLQLMQ